MLSSSFVWSVSARFHRCIFLGVDLFLDARLGDSTNTMSWSAIPGIEVHFVDKAGSAGQKEVKRVLETGRKLFNTAVLNQLPTF